MVVETRPRIALRLDERSEFGVVTIVQNDRDLHANGSGRRPEIPQAVERTARQLSCRGRHPARKRGDCSDGQDVSEHEASYGCNAKTVPTPEAPPIMAVPYMPF